MDKIFLSDVDGVLFQFSKTFEKYVKSLGLKTSDSDILTFKKAQDWVIEDVDKGKLTDDFFESEQAKNFIPFQDAVDVVNRLRNNGWQFVAITAIGHSNIAKKNRQVSLDKIFGKNTFKLITTQPKEPKYNVLRKFNPTFWVDDHVYRVIDGVDAGHTVFHMDRTGKMLKRAEYTVVKSWYDIENLVDKYI